VGRCGRARTRMRTAVARRVAAGHRLASTSSNAADWTAKRWAAPAVLPRLGLRDGSVRALLSPPEFYESLKAMMGAAERQVSIASLYFGPGEHEEALLAALRGGEQRQVRTTVAIDGSRGRRPGPSGSSAEFLQHGLQGSEWTLGLFLHPHARHWIHRAVKSSRFQEGSGVMHAKMYVSDDSILLTGANLSQEYFEGRQDRYLQVTDPSLANHCHRAVAQLASSPLSSPSGQQDTRSGVDLSLVRQHLESQSLDEGTRSLDPSVCPVSLHWHCGALGIHHDRVRLHYELSRCGEGDEVDLATGYCNLGPDMVEWLTAAAKRGANVRALTASPAANGFLNASKMPAALPMAYSMLLHDLSVALRREGVLNAAHGSKAGECGKVTLLEWCHPTDHWWSDIPLRGGVTRTIPPQCAGSHRRTFHAKGLWVTRPDTVLTAVGGSNFGRRSLSVDLELQAWLGEVGRESETGREILRERDALFSGPATYVVDDDILGSAQRYPTLLGGWSDGLWIHVAKPILTPWF
jgi:CDP-diacylglycerol---glycerol-3-phosphate 3-phosphatidyltransferase